MAAIGNATKHGFLVREGDALERLAKVRVMAFDKTGTLTYGTPEVVVCKSLTDSLSDAELYQLVASAEQFSEHPLGKAIVACCKKQGEAVRSAVDFAMIPGCGVSAVVSGKHVLAGNAELLTEHGVRFIAPAEAESYLAQGSTITYVAVEGVFAGFLALSDTLREESASMIDALSELSVRPVLLTGDHENAARTIAGKLHIADVRFNCLPQDKLTAIDQFQSGGEPVCMIGDGINDAPALKKPRSVLQWVQSEATLRWMPPALPLWTTR